MNIARCPIFQALVRDPGCCDGCNEALSGRRRRWCSTACEMAYYRNHGWTEARHEATRRATVFVTESRPEVVWDGKRAVRTGRQIEVPVALWVICDSCGRECSGKHGGYYGDGHDLETAAEVNHVDPRVGGEYDGGCWNHQTNLQVLCHACHVEETRRQARERAAMARPVDLTQPLWAAR